MPKDLNPKARADIEEVLKGKGVKDTPVTPASQTQQSPAPKLGLRQVAIAIGLISFIQFISKTKAKGGVDAGDPLLARREKVDGQGTTPAGPAA